MTAWPISTPPLLLTQKIHDGGVSGQSSCEKGCVLTSSSTTGNNLVDIHICPVASVRQLTIVVGETERRIPVPGSHVRSIHEANPNVPRGLDQETAFANVAGNHLVDFQPIDIPDFDEMRSRPLAVDDVHGDVAVPSSIPVESYSKSAAEVEVDLAEFEILGAREAQAKVRVSSHGQVWDRRVVGVDGLNRATASSVADVDSAADLEYAPTRHRDGTLADRSRRNDRDSLSGADGIEGRLDSGPVVGAGVDVGVAPGSRERVARPGNAGIRCAGAALGLNGRCQGEQCRRDYERKPSHTFALFFSRLTLIMRLLDPQPSLRPDMFIIYMPAHRQQAVRFAKGQDNTIGRFFQSLQ